MSNLFFALAPLYGLMLVGYFLARLPFVTSAWNRPLIAHVWYMAMPLAVLSGTIGKPLPSVSDIERLTVYFIPLICIFLIATKVGGTLFSQRKAAQGIFGYSSCFGNIIYMGLPLMTALFGDAGSRLMILIISVHELILVTLTMITVEREKGSLLKALFAGLLKSLKTPLILAILAGYMLTSFAIEVPIWATTLASQIGSTAAPIGLLVIGMTLSGLQVAGDRNQALAATGLKLIGLPVVVCMFALFVGLPSDQIGMLTIIAALPTGLNAFNLAVTLKTAEGRTATTILYSNLLSLVTLSSLILLTT